MRVDDHSELLITQIKKKIKVFCDLRKLAFEKYAIRRLMSLNYPHRTCNIIVVLRAFFCPLALRLLTKTFARHQFVLPQYLHNQLTAFDRNTYKLSPWVQSIFLLLFIFTQTFSFNTFRNFLLNSFFNIFCFTFWQILTPTETATKDKFKKYFQEKIKLKFCFYKLSFFLL
jgi:hypothetical protein